MTLASKEEVKFRLKMLYRLGFRRSKEDRNVWLIDFKYNEFRMEMTKTQVLYKEDRILGHCVFSAFNYGFTALHMSMGKAVAREQIRKMVQYNIHVPEGLCILREYPRHHNQPDCFWNGEEFVEGKQNAKRYTSETEIMKVIDGFYCLDNMQVVW